MKLAVIGGGGVRSMFLSRSIARRATAAGISSVIFMDADERKLGIFGAMSRRVAASLAPELDFRLSSDLGEAVDGTDYVITTVRVGGDASRAKDERFALDLGLLGQETTGAGGFLMAARTIPAVVEICEEVKRRSARDAVVFNFSNPAGLVVQALRDCGYDRTYGVCDAPSGFLRQIAALYGRKVDDLTSLCFGLNHLSFFKSVKLDGRELVDELLADPRLYSETDMRFFEPRLARRIGMLLNEYLYYYYYRERAVSNVLSGGVSRGEFIAECNTSMLEELSGIDVEKDFPRAVSVFEKWHGKRERNYMAVETGAGPRRMDFAFRLDEADDGGYAGVALAYIDAVAAGRKTEMILNLPNGDSIEELHADDVVELSCEADRDGIRPKKVRGVGSVEVELIRRVKTYERAAARAILERDAASAADALFLHPLIASYSLAERIARYAFDIGGEAS
jgi:6-phospho-beta-glucosidase